MRRNSSYRYRTVTASDGVGLSAFAYAGWRGPLPPGGGALERGGAK
jgi:hypothetical protein